MSLSRKKALKDHNRKNSCNYVIKNQQNDAKHSVEMNLASIFDILFDASSFQAEQIWRKKNKFIENQHFSEERLNDEIL